MFFSSNTVGYNHEEISVVLQMPEANDHCTYLGLPNILGKNKASILGFLREKVRKCIQGWDGTILLGRGGGEVLIKMVIQALHMFAMSVFLLPVGIIRDMEKLMNKFWWQTSSNLHRGIHWMEWGSFHYSQISGRYGV